VDSAAPEIDGNGDYQCRNRCQISFGAAADRYNSSDSRMEDGVPRAGAVGFAWVISWSVTYRSNNETSIATLDARLVARKLSFTDVLSMRGPHDRSNLHGKLSAQTNDVLYAQNEASQCNIDLKTAAVARSLFENAIEQGLGDKDMASVIEPLRTK
jgi:hypothetical protein